MMRQDFKGSGNLLARLLVGAVVVGSVACNREPLPAPASGGDTTPDSTPSPSGDGVMSDGGTSSGAPSRGEKPGAAGSGTTDPGSGGGGKDPPQTEPAPVCKTDDQCRLAADYSGGCHCVALAPNDPVPVCKEKCVNCFADPCLTLKALCSGGRCLIAGESPPIVPACTTHTQISDLPCRTYPEWKELAHSACVMEGKLLSDLGAEGERCGGDGAPGTEARFRELKYVCCSPPN